MTNLVGSAPCSHTLSARAVWGCGLALAALQIAAFHGVRGDDAFITYRYGQNLASGFGLVFTPGERVQGFTSPGHALLAALVYAVCGRSLTPDIMAALGCVAWSAEVVALYRLLEVPTGRLAAGSSALLIGLGAAAGASWVVLETHFVSACVLLAFVAASRRRWILAAVGCGLGVLFRPDAVLAAGLVLGESLWRSIDRAGVCEPLRPGAASRPLEDRALPAGSLEHPASSPRALRAGALPGVLDDHASLRARVRAFLPCAVFLAIALPWPLFASGYFGSALPQTALTKFQRVQLFPYVMHELGYPSRRLLWSGAPLVFYFVTLALAGRGALLLWRRGLWQLPAYGLLHGLSYAYLRPFTEHSWHLYPCALVFCSCVVCGLLPLRAAGAASRQAGSAALRYSGVALCVVLLAIAFVRAADDAAHLSTGYWTGQRDAVYRRIAGYLRAHVPKGQRFAAVEVGTLGYYSDLPVYDLGGLVTPPDAPLDRSVVRFSVVDRAFPELKPSPSARPSFVARQGDFSAEVYDLPPK
jgi:hypothetical protein